MIRRFTPFYLRTYEGRIPCSIVTLYPPPTCNIHFIYRCMPNVHVGVCMYIVEYTSCILFNVHCTIRIDIWPFSVQLHQSWGMLV